MNENRLREQMCLLTMLLRGCEVNQLTPAQIADVVTHFNVEWDA
jgi:hypothetical protein